MEHLAVPVCRLLTIHPFPHVRRSAMYNGKREGINLRESQTSNDHQVRPITQRRSMEEMTPAQG